MLEIYRASLEKDGCFTKEYPKVFEVASEVIPSNIPEKMRILMTASELTVFAGHLRKPIMWHGAKIPVNIIAFLVGGSGAGKGKSVKSIGNILQPGLRKIDESREATAKLIAVEDAETDGKKPTDWRKYYSKPRDLKSAVSTLPGTMKHLAALEKGKLGSGYMYVDEIGSELVSNKDLSENIIALAIGYDSGEIAPKILKDDSNQVEGIKNLPYSALMFGSPINIIYDEIVKRKFKEEFSTKLSRRCHFAYVTEEVKKLEFKGPDAILQSRAYDKAERDRVEQAVLSLTPWFTSLATSTTNTPLTVSEEVEDLFSDYTRYNEWYADTIPNQFTMTNLHRLHLQWKSLKIAGAIAILEGEDSITKQHMVEAIRFSEIFAEDIHIFEIELEKEPYELFADYMMSIVESGYASISIHKLRKMGFVKGNGAAQNKMLELIELAKAYDDINKYEYVDNYIHFYEGTIDDEERDELA